jgi:hypothetical protein
VPKDILLLTSGGKNIYTVFERSIADLGSLFSPPVHNLKVSEIARRRLGLKGSATEALLREQGRDNCSGPVISGKSRKSTSGA